MIKYLTVAYDDHHEASVYQMFRLAQEDWAILGIYSTNRVFLPAIHPTHGCTFCRDAAIPETLGTDNYIGKHHVGSRAEESDSAPRGELLLHGIPEGSSSDVERKANRLRLFRRRND